MSDEVYERVDDHLSQLFSDASDPVLEGALRRAQDAGLPAIQASAPQGRLLQVLATACGARSILEIGTLARLQVLGVGPLVGVDEDHVEGPDPALAQLVEHLQRATDPHLDAVGQPGRAQVLPCHLGVRGSSSSDSSHPSAGRARASQIVE